MAIEQEYEPTEAELALGWDPGEAKWVWQEAARINALHRELASLYRSKSKDKRTIDTLWERIEEGEYALAQIGVRLS